MRGLECTVWKLHSLALKARRKENNMAFKIGPSQSNKMRSSFPRQNAQWQISGVDAHQTQTVFLKKCLGTIASHLVCKLKQELCDLTCCYGKKLHRSPCEWRDVWDDEIHWSSLSKSDKMSNLTTGRGPKKNMWRSNTSATLKTESDRHKL